MSYLIQQMWACLIIAALIGAFFGWWLAKVTNQKNLNELDANWKRKFADKEAEYARITAKTNETVSTTTIDPVVETANEPEIVSAPIPEIEREAAPEIEATNKAVAETDEQSSYDIEEVEGIGKNYGKKLRDMGISTTEQLLNKCCDLDGRITVAENIGIEDFVVYKWASMSDLMRLNGVAGQLSELMVSARIDTVQDLSQQDANTLHKKLSDINQQQERVETIPDENTLELMITQAKSLKEIMTDS